jgi:hypothetical protein
VSAVECEGRWSDETGYTRDKDEGAGEGKDDTIKGHGDLLTRTAVN